MTKNEENDNKGLVIILPEADEPAMKPMTIFLLGVCTALVMAIYINFNENLGMLLALGILVFLFIFDEGFRSKF